MGCGEPPRSGGGGASHRCNIIAALAMHIYSDVMLKVLVGASLLVVGLGAGAAVLSSRIGPPTPVKIADRVVAPEFVDLGEHTFGELVEYRVNLANNSRTETLRLDSLTTPCSETALPTPIILKPRQRRDIVGNVVAPKYIVGSDYPFWIEFRSGDEVAAMVRFTMKLIPPLPSYATRTTDGLVRLRFDPRYNGAVKQVSFSLGSSKVALNCRLEPDHSAALVNGISSDLEPLIARVTIAPHGGGDEFEYIHRIQLTGSTSSPEP